MKVVHFLPQSDQPFGSTRLCCARCGLFLGGKHFVVWYAEDWDKLLHPEYVRCVDAPRTVYAHALRDSL